MRCLLPLLPVALCAPGLAAQERLPLRDGWTITAEGLAGAEPRPVTLPHTFEDVFGSQFDGVARYRLRLPLPAARRAAVRVEFAGVATHATVFCNGKPVAEHLGGWTPFRADLTAALRWNGEDVLEVRVDERVGHNTQGFLPIVQPHFGGIWQGVTLCLDDGPVLDHLAAFWFGSADGVLRYQFAALPPSAEGLQLELRVLDGSKTVATTTVPFAAATAVQGELTVPGAAPWSPHDPHLYTVQARLLMGEVERDRIEGRVGFRTLAADGTRITWNGAPLQLRGVLHWGYAPPHFAPPNDREFWRRQLRDFQSLGFNCLKCCLWVPPRCVYELCDELGMLVWQEYPTWHPRMDQAHQAELLREYGEFFGHDRNHPSVAFRSITCETGHGADFAVVKALFDACKAAVPNTLVVDDSSWIGWQRITDFWDEHPYGNNSWLPGRLADFRRHLAEKGQKPLLLGECIAADTWLPSDRWRAQHGSEVRWWQPSCWQSQLEFETWLGGRFGPATLASLLPLSLDFGLRNRQFQIEQLRLGIPDAGYVVSVARDIPKCRMGLYDEHDQLKWPASAWAWHGNTMLCLDLGGARRALDPDELEVPVRISHYGRGAVRGRLQLACPQLHVRTSFEVDLASGTVSEPFVLRLPEAATELERVRITAQLTDSHPAQSHWDLWRVPAWRESGDRSVLEVDRLTPEVLALLEQGARVLLHAGDRPGSLRTEGMWFLKGAPFAPPHPCHTRLPRELLCELAAFDLESGRTLPWDLLRAEFEPILAFWETHDIDQVRAHLLAGETRVGKGRLLATTLRLDGAPHALGSYVAHQLREHLRTGHEPHTALAPATLAALRAKLTEKVRDLPVWRFRTDPEDQGRAGGWMASDFDTSGPEWRDLKAGSHWENQAEDLKHYTGVAWYRVTVEVPQDWAGLPVRAVFDGVDDSFELWVDGAPAGTFGDAATKHSIWLERQVAELGERLPPGPHTLTLRVVDHAGAGGLWKPVFLTTGPTDARSRLLH